MPQLDVCALGEKQAWQVTSWSRVSQERPSVASSAVLLPSPQSSIRRNYPLSPCYIDYHLAKHDQFMRCLVPLLRGFKAWKQTRKRSKKRDSTKNEIYLCPWVSSRKHTSVQPLAFPLVAPTAKPLAQMFLLLWSSSQNNSSTPQLHSSQVLT
jgi:hypothetical protein